MPLLPHITAQGGQLQVAICRARAGRAGEVSFSNPPAGSARSAPKEKPATLAATTSGGGFSYSCTALSSLLKKAESVFSSVFFAGELQHLGWPLSRAALNLAIERVWASASLALHRTAMD